MLNHKQIPVKLFSLLKKSSSTMEQIRECFYDQGIVFPLVISSFLKDEKSVIFDRKIEVTNLDTVKQIMFSAPHQETAEPYLFHAYNDGTCYHYDYFYSEIGDYCIKEKISFMIDPDLCFYLINWSDRNLKIRVRVTEILRDKLQNLKLLS